MNKKLLYKKAYSLLGHKTPLKFDCGTLCDKACCKGDEDTGMYLFPGEEEMLASTGSFMSIKPTKLYISNKTPIMLAVCNGWCKRELRPLSCRIFPLTPYISHHGTLEVIMDPRARFLCPLADFSQLVKIDCRFKRSVRNVFRLLMQDDEIKKFVRNLSRILDEYACDDSKL